MRGGRRRTRQRRSPRPRFAADGYAIALMARRTELTAKLADELPGAKVRLRRRRRRIGRGRVRRRRGRSRRGRALIYNAGSGVWGNIDEVKAEDLERSWRVNALGLFLTAAGHSRHAPKGEGAIIVVGATASRRGAAGAAVFAQARWRRAPSPNRWPAIVASGDPRRADRRRRRGRGTGDALPDRRPSG